jgi:tetrahydromethanopterin S-methyltransferase subunit B
MLSKASSAVNAKYKTHTVIVNVDPIYNDEQELEGYMAYTKP